MSIPDPSKTRAWTLWHLVGPFVGILLIYYFTILAATIALIAGLSLGIWLACRFTDWTPLVLVQNERQARLLSPKRNADEGDIQSSLFHLLSETKSEEASLDNCFKNRLLISKNVDPVIEELIDFALRDHLFKWYVELVNEDKHQLDLRLKNELWLCVSRTLSRLRSIDQLTFFTGDLVDCVTKHFHKVNQCHQAPKATYELSAHLETEDDQLNFLRKISEVMLSLMLPRCYLNILPLRHLLREILAVQVLHNSLELLCDPDYLNQKILDYIKWQEVETERNRRMKYAYAETYDEFIEMIKHSSDVEDLKRMRYYIVTEIMQSTAINNLKKERGLDVTREGARPLPGHTVKGDHLLARNLPRYINQLRYAKKLCEARIKVLSTGLDSASGMSLPHPKKTVFAFSIIMSVDESRQVFRKFLQSNVGQRQSPSEKTSVYLVMFWESVDDMKKSSSVRQYEIAHDLLNHSYFLNSIKNHIKFPAEVLKGMESFIMGNSGPDSFYQTQRVVYRILEDRYYPLFIVSKDYDEMITHAEEIGLNKRKSIKDAVDFSQRSDERIKSGSISMSVEEKPTVIGEHIQFSKDSLKKLHKTITGKRDALLALRNSAQLSSKPTTEMQMRIQKLDKEVHDIEEETHQTESHVQRSQLWLRYLGQWRAELYSILPEASPLAMVLVHLGSMQEDMHCDGWVVTRTMQEVGDLKRKLSKLKPALKKIEILRLRNISEESTQLIEKAKSSLNEFFQAVLDDELCCRSEDLYLFFIPSADHLRFPLSVITNPQAGKSSLPFASFFGISGSAAQSYGKQVSHEEQQSEEELSKFLADLEGKENQKDDIAEPAYNLANEIFDLQDNAGWLRKSLIAFVQISFGQTINKQIRETVSWLLSESMIYYYLCQFRDAMWPNGRLAEPFIERCQQEKDASYQLAKEKLVNNIPDFLTNLLGHQNARKGMSKVFDVLQHKELNKQLFYELLEVFIYNLVPELRNKETVEMHPSHKYS